MTRSTVALWGVLLLAATAAGCGRTNDNAKLTELQRVRSGTLDIVLLSPREALRHGQDTFVIELRSSADGSLVDGGDVRVTATMPMPGMPMFGSIDVRRGTVPGRYEAKGELSMAGTWRMTVEWSGPNGKASATFPETVQ